ncbi:type II toxin-antitoxin system PemK/MazF family toxin [Sphaerospermopsis sp. LEGE 08334]|uniref:type II toxin-antitoxin system PemK/MazF family toxin n=1 Tax=Sphaerospermopsis sp. LEGE 08334 TaxID=1828651 RepID=UPI0035CD1525
MVDIKRGDVVFCDLNPVIGTEQAGIRTVLVMQIDRANAVMTRLLKDEFQKFCDQVGENAEAKGMTEEKLKEILESNDKS